jgi:TolA-binding protein
MDALKAMKDLPLEESIKMKTVFMTLSTKGLTVPKIVDSATAYLGILDKERTKFYQALDAQKNQNINKKKGLIDELNAKNKEKAEMIKKLTDEIAANNSEIQKITIEVNMGETKIKSTENDFIFTFDKLSSQIKENIEKIKQINGQ